LQDLNVQFSSKKKKKSQAYKHTGEYDPFEEKQPTEIIPAR
jgi:hypothetical protein